MCFVNSLHVCGDSEFLHIAPQIAWASMPSFFFAAQFLFFLFCIEGGFWPSQDMFLHAERKYYTHGKALVHFHNAQTS